MAEFDIAPDPEADGLTTMLDGLDASGQPVNLPVVAERPLTIILTDRKL